MSSSSWSEIRLRTRNAFGSIIAGLIQKQNQFNAVNLEITDADTIMPRRILTSKSHINSLLSGYARVIDDSHFGFPLEPDGDIVRMWYKFDHMGYPMEDLSYADNNCDVIYGKVAPILIANMYDDGITGGRLHTITNPIEAAALDEPTYYRVSGNNKIKDIYNSGYSGFSVFYRCFPIVFDNEIRSGGEQRGVLFEEIDNDQVEYAMRVEGDGQGHLYFYVRFQHIDYQIDTTGLAESPLSFISSFDFNPEDFSSQDYQSGTESASLPETAEFTDLFFTFDFDTKKLKIIKNGETLVESDSDFVIPQSNNLTMWLPLLQGNSESLVDISGIGNNGSFIDNDEADKPQWILDDGKYALEFDDPSYATIENSASLNTLTTFSISIVVKTSSDFLSNNTTYKNIFGKDWTGFGNGAWSIYADDNNPQDLKFECINNSSVTRLITSTSTLANDQVYHIVVTYNGSTYRLYVNNVEKGTASASSDTLTNSNQITLGADTGTETARCRMSHAMFWKGVALSVPEIDDLYNSLSLIYDENPFPVYQDEPPEPPAPGTPYNLPFTQVYDNAGTSNTYKKANAVTISGITNVYNVSGGTPVSDPISTVYDVAPGISSGTTDPFIPIYTQNGTSSDEVLSNNSNDSIRHAAKVENSSSSLYGKKITKIEVWCYRSGSVSGNVSAGIRKGSDGSFISFGSTPASGLPTSYSSKTVFTLTTNTYTLTTGDYVSVEYNGPGQVRVARSTSLNDANSKRYYYDTSWHSTGTNYNLSLVIYTGGGTTSTDPYLQITNGDSDGSGNYKYYAVGEVFPTGSPMIGQTLTDISVRVYRHASATTGNVYLRHVDSNNAVKGTLKTATISSLPTSVPTTFNWTWQDYTYPNPIAPNDRILVVVSGGSTTNPVYVLGNEGATGSPSSYDSPNTRSCVTYRRAGYPGFFGIGAFPEAWTTNTARDISGIMKIGGNDYTSYTELWNTRWRAGICVNTGSSSLKDKVITKVTATFKKVGTPASGSIFCRIRTFTGTVRTTIQQKDVSEVNDTDTSIDFINTTHGYALGVGDLISIEYELGTASDHILIRNNKNAFESTNTQMFDTANSSDVANLLDDRDLAAQLYIGGELDITARPIVGLKVNHPASILAGIPVTKAELYLKRVGSFGGGEFGRVKVIRWSDKITVSVLDTIELNDIPTTETLIPFENTGNSYPLADGDIIAFENTYGDVDNYIQVKVSDNNTLDDTKTQMIDYDGTTYYNIAQDIAGKLYKGGYTVYPDPSIPNPPEPYHYNHKLYITAGLPDDSQALDDPDNLQPKQYSGVYLVMDDFRIYADIITDEQALNLFNNKYTINLMQYGTVKVIGHDKIEDN